jgi:hypothetical protein
MQQIQLNYFNYHVIHQYPKRLVSHVRLRSSVCLKWIVMTAERICSSPRRKYGGRGPLETTALPGWVEKQFMQFNLYMRLIVWVWDDALDGRLYFIDPSEATGRR